MSSSVRFEWANRAASVRVPTSVLAQPVVRKLSNTTRPRKACQFSGGVLIQAAPSWVASEGAAGAEMGAIKRGLAVAEPAKRPARHPSRVAVRCRTALPRLGATVPMQKIGQ